MLEFPRQTAPMTYRVMGAEHIELSVRAPLWLAEMACKTAFDLVVECLMASGAKAFCSVAELEQLPESEVMALAVAVIEALNRVAPSQRRSDMSAWDVRLQEGARHHENLLEALAMADAGALDRYFGCPVRELTTGHRMAYGAACYVVNEYRNEHHNAERHQRQERVGPGHRIARP